MARLLALLLGLVGSCGALLAQPARSTRRIATTMMSGSQVPLRIRRKRLENLKGDRLRLNIFRSNQHIYAQVIDDLEASTKVAASSLEPAVKAKLEAAEKKGKKIGANVEAAALVGELLAERCKEAKIEKMYYDRFSGSHKYLFHGRVKSLVDAVREGGIAI